MIKLFQEGVDLIAVATVAGTLFNILPEVAALFAILWTGIRIYEWFRFRILGKQKIEDKSL